MSDSPPSGGPGGPGGPGPGGPQQPSSPPYLPSYAILGGNPTVPLDVPISTVFMAIFIAAGAVHMGVFRANIKRDHKFVFSALLFVFCLARVFALITRIVWAAHPDNLSVAVASNVLVAAGVVLLFLVNLIFTQRIVRSYHPQFGWHKITNGAFIATFALVIALLIMLITATVHSFFTLDPEVRAKDRDVQLVGATLLALLAFLPFPIVVLAIMWPYRQSGPEKFGYGSLRAQVFLVMTTSLLLTVGAGFRTGVAYDPRPLRESAWFLTKPCFYIFNFGIEVIVVIIYAAARVDRRFWVGDGSKAPGDYIASRRASMLPVYREQNRRESMLPGMLQPPPGISSGRASRARSTFADNIQELEGVASGSDAPFTSASDGPSVRSREIEWEKRAQHELEKRISDGDVQVPSALNTGDTDGAVPEHLLSKVPRDE
ncbi:hypothetical protein MCOR27_000344 [Pyricularia oryzae]|uniref:Uncharacterized protein n=5 Tax=Pyricularia TaxID=48558 RepID=A0ABQ8NR00_PYRGI|nr:uncharacterized protein MGG_06103 [Pyricularia oryzae 70-15]ELQ43497.1 hypothetical protein OOU_Y34scaffold00149g24 [Pyricularia oryzae Y34]KAH8847410.1 hypothetical protein MCOR01_000842 [Pyricularia oryzae]KAI6300868.1 hypothetical protein MCOR33_003494 [Pyricularia grisea]EHA52161.1 hypothetical protein MGG_06103 [Pyricularia oryzae 70-15]KAH9428393.1 hypothetical protein MCOR02_010947 [Pyricularia oryzae]